MFVTVSASTQVASTGGTHETDARLGSYLFVVRYHDLVSTAPQAVMKLPVLSLLLM